MPGAVALRGALRARLRATEGGLILEGPFEIRVGLRDKLGPEGLLQSRGFDFLHRAIFERAQLERPIRDADQPVHLEPKRFENLAYFAVLALPDREAEPYIGALLAVERRLDWSVADAVDGDPALQTVERFLRHAAERAHAIAPEPAGRREFQRARESAVIGEQQQTFGI